MILIIKQMTRFIISVAVCLLLLIGLTGFFLPALVEKADITVDTMQLEEPTVLYIKANEVAGPAVTLSSVLENVKSKNTTEQLDEQFWQSIQNDLGRVFTYKNSNNAYIYEDFIGSEAGEWMLVFTSSNSTGDQYKIRISLNVS
ncbi:MAG: hypothetical protein IJZ42_13540 [Lachnospiraceae bacterium]|nr:hypothetical protein [Lachnospiraceae bacterium]